ncbi:MAG TPA: malate synthase A [Anaerolineales bacterium]|nr:malate synthase A [Anaerolineales bacterium]
MNIHGKIAPEFQEILTPEALAFVEQLEREFGTRRRELLQKRVERQKMFDAGTLPGFLEETADVRAGDWKVGSIPDDLQDRRVEITGPPERKMAINALNSGAKVFMADFEDANAPTWENLIQGHLNLRDAIERTISLTTPEKTYKLNENPATLFVRPRGWHLDEKHVTLDGKPISASLFDFGLYLFLNADRLRKRGTGPYFYLPKLESHLEARLWNDVFNFAQDKLDIPRGTIKVTVLIETILAAFEMDEILYELREHIVALNAGRWDYIFSTIKKFSKQPGFLLPDRAQVTMTVPFMRAYTELLVKTCHKRGAHAIGGMAAFIPSRKDPQVNEAALSKVREDKLRESADGFDGTWVAHPDLVPVAMEVFDSVLKDKPHQKEKLREEVNTSAADLVNFNIPNGQITEAGMRLNINVGLQYLDAWLRGSGAVAIHNLMEDAATAEICRAQLWQWIHHPTAALSDGRKVSERLYRQFLAEELEKIQTLYGAEAYAASRMNEALQLFDDLVTSNDFAEFLTLSAYGKLD